MCDTFETQLAGFVKIREADTANVVFDGQNVVTNSAVEAILRSLVESDFLRYVVFANTGGQALGPETKALPGVQAVAPIDLSTELKPETLKDLAGLRSVGRWRAVLTPTGDASFDALGLVSSAGLLVAALSVSLTTVHVGAPLVVEWTLALRGAGSYWPPTTTG